MMMYMFDEFKTCLTNHMHVMDILIDIRIKIELIVVKLGCRITFNGRF